VASALSDDGKVQLEAGDLFDVTGSHTVREPEGDQLYLRVVEPGGSVLGWAFGECPHRKSGGAAIIAVRSHVDKLSSFAATSRFIPPRCSIPPVDTGRSVPKGDTADRES